MKRKGYFCLLAFLTAFFLCGCKSQGDEEERLSWEVATKVTTSSATVLVIPSDSTTTWYACARLGKIPEDSVSIYVRTYREENPGVYFLGTHYLAMANLVANTTYTLMIYECSDQLVDNCQAVYFTTEP